MRKWLVVLTCLSALLAAVPVRAQAAAHFSSVQVDIWPEYDRPALLVIDRLTLASGTVLPASLTLRVPTSAQVWAVAVADSSGALADAPYDSQVQGGWTVLTITSDSLRVQVEYYDNLDKVGSARHVAYHWAGDGAVDAFTVDVLLPPGASDPVLTPPIASSGLSGGLLDYRSGAFSLNAGQAFSLEVDYQKSTDSLSISGMSVQPAQPVAASSGLSFLTTNNLKIFIEVLAGLLIGAFVVWLFFLVLDRRRSAAPAAEAESAAYCSQCGRRAQPGDVFCRSCGTRLRKGAS